jgi:hypothetical protein
MPLYDWIQAKQNPQRVTAMLQQTLAAHHVGLAAGLLATLLLSSLVHAAAAKIAAGLNTKQYACTSVVVFEKHELWQP